MSKWGVKIFWAIIVVIVIYRFVIVLYEQAPTIEECLGKVVSGTGIIRSEPSANDSGQSMFILAKNISFENKICASNILFKAKTKLYPIWKYDDMVNFTGKISKPFNFKSDNNRTFDYIGYLYKDDIYFEMKSAKIDLVSHGSRYSISAMLFEIKRSFVKSLRNALGEPHAALAGGLVVGEKSALGSDLLDDFRRVGLIHIVVLSGFNITIVADALRRLLTFLPRVWGIVIGAIGIVLFGIMVGGGATVLRSCIMASIALLADLLRKDYSVSRALILAGLVMVAINPKILLHDPSFQLSFLATTGLILLASPIEKRLTFITEKFGLRGIVASTLAAQIFVSPYILYMMGNISIVGLVVNIVVLPIIPITMLMVFLTGVSGIVSSLLGEYIGYIAHILLSYELFIVEQFAELPFASIELPPFSFYWVCIFYTVMIVVILRFRDRTSEVRSRENALLRYPSLD